MFRQPALATSALHGLHDELLAYLTLFCAPEDLLALARVNSVFYVFAREEPLWMLHCLRLHGGDFHFRGSWRLTTFFPRPERAPKDMPERLPGIAVRNFGSDFLYRRWCRGHMSLKDFVPPQPDLDPYTRRIHVFDVKDLSYQDYYEQYARVPFILKNAITEWKASTDWTMDQLATRFDDASVHRHRLTHNLDTTSEKATQMTFRDYTAYLQTQEDETPLYVFDPRFGEKMPSILADYNVSDLKIFQEDLLQLVASTHEALVPEKKDKIPKSIRPDFRWLVIGPERSGAPWHTDPARTSAWNALVKGRKRWAIYPPGSPPPGISVGKNDSGREHALNMTSLYWYLHVYPTLAPHQRPLEVVQEEGDVIYVPSGWWHLVLNIDETIAVTQNFVDSHNVTMFMKDLLDDQQDEALQLFQHALKDSSARPELFDVCRLMLIPRVHGYLNTSLYMSAFRDVNQWKRHVRTVLTRHKLGYEQLRKKGGVVNLTARVNPTFAVGSELLVKFYSQFNEDWGEFDLTTYLSPDFGREDDTPEAKRRKTTVLAPHQLKKAMTLRYAMEECFRVEKTTYAMLSQADASLQALVPKMHTAAHLWDVSDVDDEDGEGALWRWPYVVMEYKRGLCGIATVVNKRRGASLESWKRLAKWVNVEFLPRLHGVAIDSQLTGLLGHSKATWEWYEHYLLTQRKRALAFHLKEDAIPPQLMNQLEAFLLPASPAVIAEHVLPPLGSSFRANVVLLHGDLTDENVLGTAGSSSVSVSDRDDSKANARAWLEAIGCGQYADLLVEQQELTLSSVRLTTEAHLKELGVPLGPRLQILEAASKLDSTVTQDAFDSDSDSDSEDEEPPVNEYVAAPRDLETLRQSRRAKFYGDTDWTPRQVVDFADAKTGDPLYDLVAIFFGALHCDPVLWREAVATPYWQQYVQQEMQARQLDAAATGRVVSERFLRLTLLHPSRSVKSLFHFFPGAVRLSSWPAVADAVFGDLFHPK